MGVYIKGMVMPYGCANCYFVSEPIYDAKGRATYVCNVPVEEVRGKGNTDEVFALYEGALEAFPDWCPLAEIPEDQKEYVLRSMETVLESDERTMGKPVSEIGWIFDKIHEWKEILSKLEI